MDMDHLIGQRFNLISRSEIRYLGTLHEINPEQSTIALEEVYSFGTEGRPAKDFIPGSSQKFDYIVFRGSDVKDIKIADEQKENRLPDPNVPNDPAILNASRPGPPSPVAPSRKQPPFPPANFQQQPQHPPHFQNPYPPYDRGFGPPPGGMPPGPGFPGMPYGAPPPGYLGPSGQPFPQFHGQFRPPPQMPMAPPGQRPPSGPPQQLQPTSQPPNELPVNDRAQEAAGNRIPTPISTVSPAPGPTPPNGSKPSVLQALGPVSKAPGSVPPPTTNITSTAAAPVPAKAPVPGSKAHRVVPALPMMVNNKSSAPLMSTTVNGALGTTPAAAHAAPPTQIAMEEANRQARAAVANAMAKMNTNAQTVTNQPKPVPGGNAVDTLTQKVGEMRTSDGPRGGGGGRGGMRGQRGNFRGGPRQGRKIEIPSADYDFETANAKFNKEDMIKEAIASSSPLTEPHEDGYANGAMNAATNGENGKESLSPVSTEAYNKSSSFFDNISSEAKDREDANNQHMGRGWKGEEIRKNLETFGQGSVDGGFRGRGRGGPRGRGGRPYGGQRGYGYGRGGAYRGRGRGAPASAPVS